jgi:hypothetical protein
MTLGYLGLGKENVEKAQSLFDEVPGLIKIVRVQPFTKT